MNKVEIKTSIAILLCSSLLWEAYAIELSQYTDEQALSEISDQITRLSPENRANIAKDIYQSGRSALILDVIAMLSLPIEKEIIDAPSSKFKDQLAIQILRSDDMWTIPLVAGSSGIGSLYQRSLIVCDSIIAPYYKEGEIDWSGPLTKERRIQIADNFEKLLATKYKSETSSVPHQDRKSQHALTENRNRSKEMENSATTQKQTNNLVKLKTFAVFVVALLALALATVTFRRRFKRSDNLD